MKKHRFAPAISKGTAPHSPEFNYICSALSRVVARTCVRSNTRQVATRSDFTASSNQDCDSKNCLALWRIYSKKQVAPAHTYRCDTWPPGNASAPGSLVGCSANFPYKQKQKTRHQHGQQRDRGARRHQAVQGERRNPKTRECGGAAAKKGGSTKKSCTKETQKTTNCDTGVGRFCTRMHALQFCPEVPVRTMPCSLKHPGNLCLSEGVRGRKRRRA